MQFEECNILYALIFILGFFSFPLLNYILINLLFSNRENATIITNKAEITPFLKKLFNSRWHDSVICLHTKTLLEIRVNKKKYKQKGPSLEIEVRFGEKTRKLYEPISNIFIQENLEYSTKLTPKKELPSRIKYNFSNSGIFSITQISSIMYSILQVCSGDSTSEALIDYRDMHFWGNYPNPQTVQKNKS